ncbi:MAG: site-specific integrase, partial [Acidisphaera sp.]|nr:site-specific integrase [Acidisphaera sp.]
ADIRELRAGLKGFAPAMTGLSERRWCNALSLLRRAIASAGISLIPVRSREPFASEWTAIFRPPLAKHACIALSRFARYCSERGITLADVDDRVFQAFGRDIEADSLVMHPHTVHQRAAVVWNQLATLLPGWSGRSVSVPDYRRTYILPWAAFPASLLADVEAYHHHLAGPDLLEERDFQPLKPASLQTSLYRLRAYLAALVHRGRDPQTLQQLGDVVPVAVVTDGLRFFRDRDPDGWTSRAYDIACMITPMARHWVKVEPDHLKSLQGLCRRLKPRRQGMTQKNRERLRQFDDPATVAAFVSLAPRLVAEVTKAARVTKRLPTRAEALIVQTAVAHELLLMVPIRLKNLAHLDLDRHLIRTGTPTQLSIPDGEVKNGMGMEAILPAETAGLLDLYIERYRPLLTPEPSAWLFPGIGNRGKSLERLRGQISRQVKRSCGIAINPHLYRHIAAKLFLDANPGAYGVVRLLLCHRSLGTTTGSYCGTETAAAVRHFDEHILSLRGNATRRKTDGRR